MTFVLPKQMKFESPRGVGRGDLGVVSPGLTSILLKDVILTLLTFAIPEWLLMMLKLGLGMEGFSSVG